MPTIVFYSRIAVDIAKLVPFSASSDDGGSEDSSRSSDDGSSDDGSRSGRSRVRSRNGGTPPAGPMRHPLKAPK